MLPVQRKGSYFGNRWYLKNAVCMVKEFETCVRWIWMGNTRCICILSPFLFLYQTNLYIPVTSRICTRPLCSYICTTQSGSPLFDRISGLTVERFPWQDRSQMNLRYVALRLSPDIVLIILHLVLHQIIVLLNSTYEFKYCVVGTVIWFF